MKTKIVGQAIEYIGDTTRCWSRWNDGSLSYCRCKTVAHETHDGALYEQTTGFPQDAPCAPPGLRWFQTGPILADARRN